MCLQEAVLIPVHTVINGLFATLLLESEYVCQMLGVLCIYVSW